MTVSRPLIIGGGIGGLCLAVALRARGISSLVFERADALREVGAGLTIWTNATKVLRRLGLLDSIMTNASITEQFQLRTWRGQILDETSPGEMGRRLGCPNIVVHRADLLRTLASALPAHSISLAMKCIGFEQDAEAVTAHFADGSISRGDVLIGADGLHSPIRDQLFGNQQPRYAGYTCWRGLAEYEGEALPPGLGFEAWGRGRRFAIQHCGKGSVFWYATCNAPESSSDGPNGRKQDVRETFAGWCEPISQVIEATPWDGILKNDITDRKPVPNWSRGRVTLLGDAAHPMTPNFGQGACQAIEDAFVLADCLAKSSNVPESLRYYDSARVKRTAMVTRASRRLGAASQCQNSFLCWLRDTITRSGIARGSALKQFEEMLGFKGIAGIHEERHEEMQVNKET